MTTDTQAVLDHCADIYKTTDPVELYRRHAYTLLNAEMDKHPLDKYIHSFCIRVIDMGIEDPSGEYQITHTFEHNGDTKMLAVSRAAKEWLASQKLDNIKSIRIKINKSNFEETIRFEDPDRTLAPKSK